MAWEAVELVIAQGPGGKWQISTGGGRYPIWSSNGRELFYETPGNRIMVSAYTAKGDSFAAAGSPAPFATDKTAPLVNTRIMDLFGTAVWNLDLTPDGKRFAVIPRPQPTGEQKGSVHLN